MAIMDQPQPVGTGFCQIDIVGDQQNGTGIIVQGMDQRLATIDIQVACRLV